MLKLSFQSGNIHSWSCPTYLSSNCITQIDRRGSVEKDYAMHFSDSSVIDCIQNWGFCKLKESKDVEVGQ